MGKNENHTSLEEKFDSFHALHMLLCFFNLLWILNFKKGGLNASAAWLSIL